MNVGLRVVKVVLEILELPALLLFEVISYADVNTGHLIINESRVHVETGIERSTVLKVFQNSSRLLFEDFLSH